MAFLFIIFLLASDQTTIIRDKDGKTYHLPACAFSEGGRTSKLSEAKRRNLTKCTICFAKKVTTKTPKLSKRCVAMTTNEQRCRNTVKEGTFCWVHKPGETCKGITRKGLRCKKKVKNSAYCHLHR